MRPRLGITTTTQRARTLIPVAQAVGIEPVVLPCIAVEPAARTTLDSVRAEASHSDWLLITSPRTVEILWPDGGIPDVPVAAVGRATAGAVSTAGGRVGRIGDQGLLSLTDEWDVTGKKVTFPHSSLTDLASVGKWIETAQVFERSVYTTRPIAPGADEVDAVAFASPSAVRGWQLSRDLADVVIAAIGPSTSAFLEELGHPPTIVPRHPDLDVLIQITADHMKERSTL